MGRTLRVRAARRTLTPSPVFSEDSSTLSTPTPAAAAVSGRMWAAGEDKVLKQAVIDYGPRWKLIANAIKHLGTGRTAAMCRNRYQRIRAMQNGKACKNKCKRCGQFKRGHTCPYAGSGSILVTTDQLFSFTEELAPSAWCSEHIAKPTAVRLTAKRRASSSLDEMSPLGFLGLPAGPDSPDLRQLPPAAPLKPHSIMPPAALNAFNVDTWREMYNERVSPYPPETPYPFPPAAERLHVRLAGCGAFDAPLAAFDAEARAGPGGVSADAEMAGGTGDAVDDIDLQELGLAAAAAVSSVTSETTATAESDVGRGEVTPVPEEMTDARPMAGSDPRQKKAPQPLPSCIPADSFDLDELLGFRSGAETRPSGEGGALLIPLQAFEAQAVREQPASPAPPMMPLPSFSRAPSFSFAESVLCPPPLLPNKVAACGPRRLLIPA